MIYQSMIFIFVFCGGNELHMGLKTWDIFKYYIVFSWTVPLNWIHCWSLNPVLVSEMVTLINIFSLFLSLDWNRQHYFCKIQTAGLGLPSASGARLQHSFLSAEPQCSHPVSQANGPFLVGVPRCRLWPCALPYDKQPHSPRPKPNVLDPFKAGLDHSPPQNTDKKL